MVRQESLDDLRGLALKKLAYDVLSGELRWRADNVLAGYKLPDGYIQVRLGGKLYLAHRLIYLMMTGEMPELIDHKDRDPSNNTWINLRAANKQINAINTGLPSNNKSGVKGVSWHKAGGKWTAQIKHNGKKIHLGSYKNLLDAVAAREQAEQELWCDLR